MRTKVVGIILAALTISLPFHSIHAQAPAALFDRLHQAELNSNLDSTGSQPFHLQFTVDIIPQVGRQAQHGMVEMWWSSPEEQRIDYDLPPYRATVVRNTKGEFRTEHTGNPPYIVTHLLQEIIHPLPLEFDPAVFRPESSKRSIGSTTFDCIQMSSAAKATAVVPTTYCFDEHSSFRIKVAASDQYNIRQKLGKFGEKYVPLDLQYTFLNKPVASAHIESLRGQQAAYSQTSDTAGLTLVPAPPAKVAGAAIASHVIHRADPIYPQAAKQNHISGTVLLHGIIGVDGKVKELDLIGSPDDLLTSVAMEAVHKWIYSPYLVNGVPTEVDTTISVTYAFNSR